MVKAMNKYKAAIVVRFDSLHSLCFIPLFVLSEEIIQHSILAFQIPKDMVFEKML